MEWNLVWQALKLVRKLRTHPEDSERLARIYDKAIKRYRDRYKLWDE